MLNNIKENIVKQQNVYIYVIIFALLLIFYIICLLFFKSFQVIGYESLIDIVCINKNEDKENITYKSTEENIFDENATTISGTDITKAWKLTIGSESVIVGVLDTGIDISHRSLSEHIYINSREILDNQIDDDNNGYVDDINGWDFSNNDNTVFDGDSLDIHGTHIAGIISAIAPKIKILPLKFINGSTGYAENAIEAINYAEKMGVSIITCSWGDVNSDSSLKKVIKNSKILFICSAGNNSSNTISIYPASFNLSNVISVTSIDRNGLLVSDANYGKNVHIAAPGSEIVSTYPGNKFISLSGSSMASAHVTGIAALIKSYYPNSSSKEIAGRIKKNVIVTGSLKEKVLTNGKVNAYYALTNNQCKRWINVLYLFIILISIMLFKISSIHRRSLKVTSELRTITSSQRNCENRK